MYVMAENVGSLHEVEFVLAFVQQERQERCLGLLASAKRRQRFTRERAHFKWLDTQFAHVIAPAAAHLAAEVAAMLRKKGAASVVWVISEDPALGSGELALEAAVGAVCGSSMGTVLSCVPGRLALFLGEESKSERLLERS